MTAPELLFSLMDTRSREKPPSGQQGHDLPATDSRKVRLGFIANELVVPEDFNEWARDEIERMFNGDCEAI